MGTYCVIHSGCVVGSDGFGFAPKEDGTYKKIPQTGCVLIADHVDIGANSTIDRATLGATKIATQGTLFMKSKGIGPRFGQSFENGESLRFRKKL